MNRIRGHPAGMVLLATATVVTVDWVVMTVLMVIEAPLDVDEDVTPMFLTAVIMLVVAIALMCGAATAATLLGRRWGAWLTVAGFVLPALPVLVQLPAPVDYARISWLAGLVALAAPVHVVGLLAKRRPA